MPKNNPDNMSLPASTPEQREGARQIIAAYEEATHPRLEAQEKIVRQRAHEGRVEALRHLLQEENPTLAHPIDTSPATLKRIVDNAMRNFVAAEAKKQGKDPQVDYLALPSKGQNTGRS